MLEHFKRALGSFWFKAGLSTALLALLMYKTDVRELAGVVRRAQPGWVLLAFAGYLSSQILSVQRWRMLARPLGFDEPFSRYFTCYFSGMYLNLFAPSTVAGDVARAIFLAGGQKRRTLAFTSVIADRGLGFIALIWVGAIAIVLQPSYRIPAPLYYGAWIVPPGTLAAWLWGPPLLVRSLPPSNKWRILVEQEIAAYWNDWQLLVRTTLLAMVFHVIQVATQVVLAWALNIQAPASFFFIFVPVVNTLGMIPISFSGVGIREYGYSVALASVGVDHEMAVALGLLSSVVVLATGVSSALVFLTNSAPRVVPAEE
ncbi:MAG: flippase-like domain-containing protein [Deltaproteobacteria bacterium]|nr:flippase-like domain-containing protein [Deltaproteobacteria bacterium]MBI3388050.1 flippase-like domain-containing protein [Deltaproteobacteria bacterium]